MTECCCQWMPICILNFSLCEKKICFFFFLVSCCFLCSSLLSRAKVDWFRRLCCKIECHLNNLLFIAYTHLLYEPPKLCLALVKASGGMSASPHLIGSELFIFTQSESLSLFMGMKQTGIWWWDVKIGWEPVRDSGACRHKTGGLRCVEGEKCKVEGRWVEGEGW